MARKIDLRNFQQYLIKRFSEAQVQRLEEEQRLCFKVGADYWFTQLVMAGEVLPPQQITPVPLARPWFLGLIDVRGTLFGITDFSRYTGGPAIPKHIDNRLLLIGQKFDMQVGLLVSKIIGLKHIEDFSEQPRPEDAPAWVSNIFQDKEGNTWKELNAEVLLEHGEFMNIAA